GRVRTAARRPRREALGGRAEGTRNDLVPDAVRPAAERAVPNEPLLLRAVDDRAAAEPRIGDEATARERWAGAVVHQRDEPVDVDTAHRRRLGHGPELPVVATEAGSGDIDREVRQ